MNERRVAKAWFHFHGNVLYVVGRGVKEEQISELEDI